MGDEGGLESIMARQPTNNSELDFIFRTPKKLKFSSLYRFYFDFILRLLYRVILFDNVPETINETFMKLILYTQGKICFLRGDLIGEGEQLLALNCARANIPDVYYIPTNVLVTNPRLKKSYNLKRGEECELVYLSEADQYNLTDINGGLYALIERTATMLADNDISINISQKNTRLVNLVSGDTQNTVDSIKAVIASMYEGDPTIVVKSSLIDKLQGIPILQNQSNNNLVELIQTQQYILSHFYEQIGITTHDQMKRERLVTAEINDNLDLALFNVDDILISLQEGLQRVNDMFGTEISARLNPIIIQQREEAEAAAASEAAAGDNSQQQLDEEPVEDPGGEPSEELDAPQDQELETQEEAAPEEEAPEEAPAEEEPSEPGQESEQETEEETPAELQEVNIEIDGDNNIVIVEGGEDVGSTDEDELSDVGSDSGEGIKPDNE